MRNGLTKKSISNMRHYIKSICVFLLLIGASLNVWGTDVKRVDNITSGDFYRIKAPNGYYLVVSNASGGKGVGTTTKNDGTVFRFTKESSNWYVTFNIGLTTYYLTSINTASNGVVNYSTTKTACPVSEYNINASTYYIKIGGTDKWLQSNTSSTGIFGAYGTMSHSYLETTDYNAITIKVSNGDGTWTTLSNRTSADFNYSVARSALPCENGWETANFCNSYFVPAEIPLASAGSSRPSSAVARYSTSPTAGTTWYPLWVYGGKYTTDVGCLAAEYYIYYNGNGTGATGVPSTSSAYESGETATVSSSSPTRSGYTFLGWSEDSEATTKDDAYDPGDSFTMPSSNVYLYAVWCKDLSTNSDYSLTPSSLSSTGVTISWSAVTGATKYRLEISDGNEDEQTFLNLTGTSKTITGLQPNTYYLVGLTAYNDCDDSYKASTTLDITTLQRYTITYNANGGTGTTPATQYRDHGASAITLSDGSGLSKAGYTLSKWNTEDDGSGADHAKGASYSTNADLALYAVWTPAVYTITYKDQGGSAFSGSHVDTPSEHPTSHTYGSATTLNSATRTGYTFEGWFTTSGCTDGTDVTSLGATAYTSNITLYAKWSPNEISITLDANTANGGVSNGSAKIDFGSSSTKTLTAATGASGNTLLGYYDATTGGHKVLETSGALAAANVTGYITDSKWSRATSPTTLYAQWSTNVYTVSFDMHGHGSSVGSQNIAHNGNVTEPTPAPSDADYRFDGWYKESTYNTVWNFSTETVTSDVTIHAKWTQRQYNKLVFGCVDMDLDTEDGDPISVTSRNGINIMATKKLVVNTTNAINGHAIAFSGTDLKFYKKTTETPIRYIELTNADAVHTLTATGENQEVYVSYNPTSASDNAIAEPQISVSCDGFTQTFDNLVQARNLPASMVIATKVGGSWYALPADKTSSDVQEGVLITVDETNRIAYGPSTLAYKIWPVKTTNGTADRFGAYSNPTAAFADRVRFSGNSDKGLNNSTANNHVWTNANLDAIDDDPADPYEWIIATSDLDAYTLQATNGTKTDYLDVYRPTSGTNQGKIVWATNSTYLSNEIHFFKLEEITPIDIIPREWKANGLVFSVAADNLISLTSGEAKYGIGGTATNDATLTRHSTGGYGLYEVALEDLTSHYGKTLTLRLKISGSNRYATTTIPIIVNANMSTKDNAPFSTLGEATKDYDVVVLSGKTLTTDATGSGAFKFRNMYLYAGSTLVNTANGNLSVYYLELRGGIKGIDAKSTLETAVPHLMLGKKISSTTGANLDMIVNTTHSYALSVPFTVNLADVNYANSLNTSTGAAINGTLNSQFQIQEYDAEQRVTLNEGWKSITSTATNLVAGKGYILQGKRPKGQPFAVIRFPLHRTTTVTNWADNENGEVAKAAVPISAAGVGNDAVSDNNKAWNLIANPYMANVSYKGGDETEFVANFTVGYLTPTDVVPWDGKYQYTQDEGSYRAYVTIPNDWYTEFPQSRANNVTFEPFKNFFIQASGPGSVTFERSYRSAVAARLAMHELEASAIFDQPAFIDINIEHGDKFAQAGLTVDKNATAGYTYGEDQNIFEPKEDLNYLKLFSVVDEHCLVGNTLTPDETAGLIPLAFYAPDADGSYVFSLDEGSQDDAFEQIILYDAERDLQTDLKNDTYNFTLEEAGLVENRFFINLKSSVKETTTEVDLTTDKPPVEALKFMYRGKMYIIHQGVIYDATGKKVKEVR